MAEDRYSVELEKLLHDLKERPAQILRGHKKLAERAQALRAPERVIWYEKLDEYSAENRKKLHDLIHKKD